MLFQFAATILCIAYTCHAQITFRDVTGDVGLRVPLAGLIGHGGARGDVDGDGLVNLFVGGFADRPDEEYAPAKEPLPSMLFLQREGGLFDEVKDSSARHFARTSGAGFANKTKGKVYATWNGNRKDSESKGGKVCFNTCALTVVHIPESERPD